MVLGHGGQLVRLVEDDEVVGGPAGIPQRTERLPAGQGVQRHDDEVASGSPERIAGPRIRPGDDAELQAEQGAKLPLPVPHEAGGRDHEHPPDAPAREHLAHVEAGHDGLAGPGVVGQQEAQRVLPEHALVDRDALVGEGVDARRLAGEGGVELMPVGEPQGFRDGGKRGRISGEVERGRGGWSGQRIFIR